MAGAPAIAQQAGELTVVAPHVVHRQAGTAFGGIPIERVLLTRYVGYGDLDLSTRSGVAVFESRISDTAREACAALDTLYAAPRYIPDPANQSCVKTAVAGAMTQAKLVIAAEGK